MFALGTVSTVLIARSLGPAGRGEYHLPIVVAAMTTYLGSLGTHQALVRMWSDARYTRDHLVTSGILLSAGLGVLSLAGTALVYAGTRSGALSDVRPAAFALAVGMVPVQIHSLLLFEALMLNGDVVKAYVFRLGGAAAQTAGVVVLFAVGELTVITVLVLYVVSVALPWLLMVGVVRDIGRFRLPVPWRTMRDQAVLGAQFMPFILFLYLNLRIDVLFISRYRGLAAVGIYSVAVVLSELVWLATDSLASATLERQANAPDEEATDITLRGIRMSLLLVALVGAPITAGAPIAIPLVYGEAFASAAGVVGWLVTAAGGMAVWKAVSAQVVRTARPWLQATVALSVLAVNVLGNLLLVPGFGIVGAALASFLSYWLAAALALAWLNATRGVPVRSFVPTTADLRRLRETVSLLKA